MTRTLARIISILFHPTVIPVLGFILFFHSGFYFSFLSWEARRFVLMVVIFTTAVLPLLTVALLALNPRYELTFETGSQRALPLLFSSAFYYLGYILLTRIDAYSVFQMLLLASIIVQVLLLLMSFKWKISCHMAALGSLTGALLALAFRTGTNPAWAVILVVLASGLTGWSRLFLDKNKLWHLEAGYATGFAVFYPVIYFI
jgi:hypothetical protein